MSSAIKLLLIILEILHAIISQRKSEEFKKNVDKIKDDPVSYARSKFGRVRNDADLPEAKDLPDSTPDTGGDGLDK